MKILKSGLILLTATLFVFACNQTKNINTNTNTTNNTVVVANSNLPIAPVEEFASARKIYSEICIKCHKEGGVGGTTEIDGKKIKAPNFASERMLKDTDADWIDAIENGIQDEGMPAFKGTLNEQEIKELVKMIRKDFQKK